MVLSRISIVILVLMNLFLIVKIHNSNLRIKNIEQNNNTYKEIYKFTETFSVNQKMNSVQLASLEYKKFSINALFEENDKYLMMYFNESMCNSCIEKTLKILNSKFISEGFKKRLIILSSYKDHRSFKVFFKSLNGNFICYNIINDSLGYNWELDLNQPIFFIMNKELLPIDLFMPEIGNELELSQFIKFIEVKHFN